MELMRAPPGAAAPMTTPSAAVPPAAAPMSSLAMAPPVTLPLPDALRSPKPRSNVAE